MGSGVGGQCRLVGSVLLLSDAPEWAAVAGGEAQPPLGSDTPTGCSGPAGPPRALPWLDSLSICGFPSLESSWAAHTCVRVRAPSPRALVNSSLSLSLSFPLSLSPSLSGVALFCTLHSSQLFVKRAKGIITVLLLVMLPERKKENKQESFSSSKSLITCWVSLDPYTFPKRETLDASAAVSLDGTQRPCACYSTGGWLCSQASLGPNFRCGIRRLDLLPWSLDTPLCLCHLCPFAGPVLPFLLPVP